MLTRINGAIRPEYNVWKAMKQRCQNPKAQSYKHYGGRGITVCERWQDYRLFIQDMGYRPSANYSIERRDNALGYTPDNCYWATFEEQTANKRVRTDNFSGRTGVYFNKTQLTWYAEVKRGGVKTLLYSGRDKDKAIQARKAWENNSL